MSMTRRFEQCLSFSRKKILFGVILGYVLAFFVLRYRYGWSFTSLFATIGQRGRVIMSYQPENPPLRDLLLKNFNETNATSRFQLMHRPIDIHLEDPVLGHTGEASGHTDHGPQDTSKSIAIGGGITSKKLIDVTASNIVTKFQFFSILLPSFCRTVTPGYHYHFYLAYDTSDPVFSDRDLLGAFSDAFYTVCRSLCPQNLNTSLHFVQCSHQGRPAWAQNDAMIEAYLDGMEYFYRVNDDSILESSGWVDAFIKTLDGYDPKNVGVVGPKHIGGNELILTYDFVHRTHLEVFGFYYPRVFTDWYADDWVTKVYMPGRMTKVPHIHLKHTMSLGQRYKNDFSIYPKLESQLRADKLTLSRYISYKKQGYTQPNPMKVIAMSVYGNMPRFTMGAIRNAQTIPAFFPGWSLRIYVASPGPSDLVNKDWIVPKRIISKLKSLGAQIVYVDTTHVKFEPQWWSHLVVDDPSVEYFLVRNADGRLSDRDAAAVADWIASTNNESAFHCIRDHPRHMSVAVESGLWGGRGAPLRDRLKPGMHAVLHDYISRSAHSTKRRAAARPTNFLSKVIWPRVRDVAYCHDSVSCKNWPSTFSFPVERKDASQFVGQRFNEHQEVDGGPDSSELASVMPDCTTEGKSQSVASANLSESTLSSRLQFGEQVGNSTTTSTTDSVSAIPTEVMSQS